MASWVIEKIRYHDDVIKWKHFPRNWPFVREFTGPGEFPTQRPVTRSFDVFFDLRLNKRLSKQPWGWVNNRHRGHYDVNVMIYDNLWIILFLSLSLKHWECINTSNWHLERCYAIGQLIADYSVTSSKNVLWRHFGRLFSADF